MWVAVSIGVYVGVAFLTAGLRRSQGKGWILAVIPALAWPLIIVIALMATRTMSTVWWWRRTRPDRKG